MDTRPTVLVIEDDECIAEVLQLALELVDYRVQVAKSGERALELARTKRPDLITLDLRLPDLDGHYVLECLQPEGDHPTVPIIVISGGHYRACATDGVVAVLPKPFDIDELTQLVRSTLARTSQPVGHV